MTNTSRRPYKKYLVDIEEEIPVTTIRSRRARFSAEREKQRIIEVEVSLYIYIIYFNKKTLY